MAAHWSPTNGVPQLPRAASPGLSIPNQPSLPARIVTTLLLWQQRAAQRRHLAGLDEALLRDIGIGRADAAREASKPFWRA